MAIISLEPGKAFTGGAAHLTVRASTFYIATLFIDIKIDSYMSTMHATETYRRIHIGRSK